MYFINIYSTISRMSLSIENRTFTDLPIMTCGIIEFQNGSLIDCSTINKSVCIRCSYHTRYFMEDRIENINSTGEITCFLIWITTLLIGMLAILGNAVIILVLQKRRTESSFEKFLIGLAICDLACSVFSTIGTSTYFLILRKNTILIAFFLKSTNAYL